MKKLIALVIAAIMVISMIPVMAISTAAAEVEGDWTVWRDPEKYEDVEEGEAIKPDPGYEYTSEGFSTICPDYTNYTPQFTVQTKEAQPLKDGFYLQIRIDEYPYGGEDGQADHWINFNISDREGVKPGNIDFGNNWLSLIRGAGNGSAAAQSFLTTMTTDEKVGSFALQAAPQIEIPMDDEGREIYTFEVAYDGTNYELKINGVVVSTQAISDALNSWIESGEYYVGVTLHAGVPDASANMTILKYGTSADDAITPVGSDSLEPEPNMLNFAEIADPSTVDTNKPALLWDATTLTTDPTGVDIKLIAQGDNSYHVIATGGAPYWQWGIKADKSYSIKDFPVFSMVLKNFWGDNGGVYFCAGGVMSARDDYKTSWSIFDDGCMMFGENEEYSLVVIDFADLELIDDLLMEKGGRIHNVRPFFSVTDTTDPEICEWDVMYMGWFRSVEEAQQYAIDRLQMAPVTEAPETDAPETEAPETNAAADTDAAVDTNGAADTKAPETTAAATVAEGCASVVGFGAVAVLAAAAAFVALKKKD
jgi:hypothetical protein